MLRRILGICFLLFTAVQPFEAHERESFQLEVLVNGKPVPEYYHAGKDYIEALKNREYSIRLTNALATRVAVALSVDGLNSIDARNSDAFSARKWVLGPYETIVIGGWQVNQKQARKFFFTSEEKSYGQWLGKTQNLGVISAVFFQESPRQDEYYDSSNRKAPQEERSESKQANREASPSSPTSSSPDASQAGSLSGRVQKKEDYAATGIGQRTNHEVRWVNMELDPNPIATLNLRYEFHPILVKMGVLPAVVSQDPLQRREQARGFKDSAFCPEPR